LRHFLATLNPARAQVLPEAGGWSVFILGLPIAADGATFDEAINEMVDALREYAADWQDHLLGSSRTGTPTADERSSWSVGCGQFCAGRFTRRRRRRGQM